MTKMYDIGVKGDVEAKAKEKGYVSYVTFGITVIQANETTRYKAIGVGREFGEVQFHSLSPGRSK
jgi:hypothetical protein